MKQLPLVMLLSVAGGPVAAEPGPTPRAVRLDLDGTVLPDGVVARLGSARFRVTGLQRIADARDVDTALTFSGEGVRAWNLRTGTIRWTWRLAGVAEVAVSSDARFAVFREGRTSWVWNVAESRRQVRLAGREVGPIGTVAFSPDGRQIATADEWEGACRLRTWDLQSGRMRLLGTRETPDGGLWFVDGGRRLLSHPSERHDVSCWDVATGQRVWQFDLGGRILACSNGPHFIVENSHRGFTLHALADGKPVPCRALATVEAGWHEVLAQSADGSRIVWSDRRANCLFVGRVAAGDQGLNPVRIDAAPGDHPLAALTPDSRRLLVTHPWFAEFDAETGRRLTPEPPEWARPSHFHDPVWTRDGRGVLARPVMPSGDGPPRPAKDRFLWGADTGQFLQHVSDAEAKRHNPARTPPFVQVPDEAFTDWTFADQPAGDESQSFLGGTLLAGNRRFGLRIGQRFNSQLPWRPIESAFERATLRPLAMPPLGLASNLAFSSSGRTLAAVQPDGVRLWDVWTGRPLRTLLPAPSAEPASKPPVTSELAFSPDATRLAVCAADGTILIVDAAGPPASTAPLRETELDRLWGELASPDPAVAWPAAARLADRPTESVPFLVRRLMPITRLTEAEAKRLLADLDAPAYRTRERATKRAAGLGDAAKVMVEAALKERTGAELRQRLETLAAALDWKHPPPADDLRRVRALAVLEHVGTEDARAKIARVAAGLPDARVTHEANAVMARLPALDLPPPKH